MTDMPKQISDCTPAELIKRRIELDAWLKHETKRMNEYFKPTADMITTLDNEILARLNSVGTDSFKTEHGTAYKSNILNVKVENRDELVDWALEHWDDGGNEMLMVSAQKDAVKNYMDGNEGKPPPGTSTSWFTRVNIRRT
jgi:hypothetical protein